MPSMSQPSAVTRLTLLPVAPCERSSGAAGAKVRRYRLAAVRATPPRDPADRFAHLRRTHD